MKAKTYINEDLSHLPKEFNWKEKIPNPESQGNCGSCYAISAKQMIISRLNIKNIKDAKISIDHILDCNYFNQGCDGGFAFFVSRFGNNFYFLDEKDYQIKNKNSKSLKRECEKIDEKNLNKVYKIGDYGFFY